MHVVLKLNVFNGFYKVFEKKKKQDDRNLFQETLLKDIDKCLLGTTLQTESLRSNGFIFSSKKLNHSFFVVFPITTVTPSDDNCQHAA